MKNLFRKLKTWNWFFLFVVICLTCIGAINNPTIPNISTCLYVGLGSGIVLGLPFAYIGRDEN